MQTYDLFLSYRTHHRARVEPLIDALAKRGVRVWRDVDRIREGDQITTELRQGLASSRALAAYATEDYADSKVCMWELASAWIAAEHHRQTGQRVILLRPLGLDKPDRAVLGPLVDHSAFVVAEDLDDVARKVAEHLAGVDSSSLGELVEILHGRRWLPLARSSSNRFVGRLSDLWDLHGKLLRSRQIGVTGHVGRDVAQVRGIGGIGKTLFVIEYARRFEAAWPGGIFWFDADASLAVEADQPALLVRRNQLLAGLAGPLGVQIFPGDLAATGHAVETALREHTAGRPYLWILDNIPPDTAQRAVDALMPHDDHGAVLLTTRWRGLASLGEHLDLEPLDSDAAWTLLTHECAPQSIAEATAARKVATAVGYHPLALDILRALLPHTMGAPYATWDARLAEPGEDALDDAARMLAEELPTGRARAISAVLAQSLGHCSELALNILRLASVLAEGPIPGELIADAFSACGEGQQRVELAIAELAAHALVSWISNVPGIHVHTLVRRVATRWQCDQSDRDLLAECACEGLRQRFRNVDCADPRTHSLLLPLLPHALAIATGPTANAARLGNDVGRIRHARGDFAGARGCFERAHAALESHLGPDHPDALGAIQNLAGSLSELGELTGARSRYEQVLGALQRTLGAEHRKTLRVQQDLALTVYEQGDLAHARTLFDEAIDVANRSIGAEEPDTIAISLNLAIVLQAQGDLPLARGRLEWAVAMMKRNYAGDSDHPMVIGALLNWAGLLAAEGDLVGSRKQYEQILAVDRRDKGLDHPDTLRVMHNLAGTLHAQGDYVGARTLDEEVLRIREQQLGSDHPSTLMSRQNLAVTLERQDELPAAREHIDRALAGLIRILGADHPRSLGALHNQSVICDAAGDLIGARQREEEALSGLQRKLGPKHPTTLSSMNHLAEVLIQQDELVGADDLLRMILSARQNIFTANHPDTLSTMQSLSEILSRQGKTIESLALCKRVLEGRERTLGSDHPNTTLSRFNFVLGLRKLDPALVASRHVAKLRYVLDRPVDSLTASERDIKLALPGLSRRHRRSKHSRMDKSGNFRL